MKTAKFIKKVAGWGDLFLLSEPVVNKVTEDIFEVQSYLLVEHISPAPLSVKEKEDIIRKAQDGLIPFKEVQRMYENCVNLIFSTQSGNPLQPVSETTKRVIGARGAAEALRHFGYKIEGGSGENISVS